MKNFKRSLSAFLSLILMLSIISAFTFAAEFTDMPDDWSTSALQSAVSNGLIVGYGGKIMPLGALTRAEMATIVNRSFGAYVKTSISAFTDVSASKWYFDDMSLAVQMKTFIGDGGSLLYPEMLITREQAFLVIARALKLEPTDVVPVGFVDLNNISSWAKKEVYAMINAGYVKGYNGYINPKNTITRAEFAQIMQNIVKKYIYAPGIYTSVPTGNIMVNVPGATLKDVIIHGDLIIGEGVGDGDLTLDGVTVEGRVIVRGGGVNSIMIIGSSDIGTIIVSRVDGAVKISVENGSTVEIMYIDDGDDTVTIIGNIGHLVVSCDVPVLLQNGVVNKITLTVPGTNITAGTGSVIGSILDLAAALANIVSLNVSGLASDPAFSVGFDKTSKTTTITVKDANASVLSIDGTGAMVVLAGIDEVRGYTLAGRPARSFYKAAGTRESMSTIKGWLLADGLVGLGYSSSATSTKLGVLVGKSFAVTVDGMINDISFTSVYTFTFVQ